MNKTHFSEIANWVQGHLIGNDVTCTGISIDSRTIAPGEIFWAIQGEQFDGHDFINVAAEKGAVACVVSQPVVTQLPILQVQNTHTALGLCATHYRQQFHIPVIAVTGSCGKTTTKALMASIFNLVGPALYPEQSFNNDIGLPLTLLRLESKHRFAILELGTNHPGELAHITAMAKPTVAGITNIAPVHLEGFGDLTGVAREKRSIFAGIVDQGTAIINADEPFITEHRHSIKAGRFISFGVTNAADVTAKNIQINAEGRLSFALHCPHGNGPVHMQLLGAHNVNNALFAAAAAYALDVPFATIVEGLETAEPESKRLNRVAGYNGAVIINDSYNANPVALFAAIELLANYKGKRVLVLADMGELGENAVDYHRQVGDKARNAGIDVLYTVGALSENASKAFGQHGRHYGDRKQLITELQQQLTQGVTVLVKGSKSQRMWEVANALIAGQGV